ncbi:MAG: hypothetical protein ACI9HE_003486 [Planctomycetota bacterium]|jgi:hypothetical protein
MYMRNMIAGAGVGLLASAALFGSGLLLYGYVPGVIEQYALTEGMGSLVGWESCLAGACVLMLLLRLGPPAALASMFGFTVPMLVAISIEMSSYPTSHNLIPIELIGLAIWSLVFHLPALTVRFLLKRVVRKRA